MKFIDSPKKRLAWYSRNYFYIATVAVVVTNIALYACLGNSWTSAFGISPVDWTNSFDFEHILRCFLNNFSHANWQHVLLNMLCFFVAGLYLERRRAASAFWDLFCPLPYYKAVSVQRHTDTSAVFRVPTTRCTPISSSTTCSRSQNRGATKPISSSAASCLRSFTLPCVSAEAPRPSHLSPTRTTFCTISGTERDFSAVRSSRCSFNCPWRRRAAAQRNRRLPAVHNTIAAPPTGSRRGCADQGPVLSKMHSRRKRLSASRYFSESSRL